MLSITSHPEPASEPGGVGTPPSNEADQVAYLVKQCISSKSEIQNVAQVSNFRTPEYKNPSTAKLTKSGK